MDLLNATFLLRADGDGFKRRVSASLNDDEAFSSEKM